MSDFDGSWKDALDFFPKEFLAFFYPDIHADIDWTTDPVALEQEFRASSPASVTGPLRCDKLLRVALHEEEETAYLHVEVQCQFDSEFPRRAFDYNQGATRQYGATISTLVLLGDDNPEWRPAEFRRERWNCWSGVGWRPMKILAYQGRDEELEQHENPVALVVLAHLKAIETRGDPVERRAWRLQLVRRVYQRSMEVEDQQRLLPILEGLLDLPEDMEAGVLREILNEQEETKMPSVSSFERYFKAEGVKEGREGGLREGLLLVVRVRFGAPDAAFLTLVENAHLPALEKAFKTAETATLDELRQILAPADNDRNGATS
jgi:hypothetical protein